MSITVTKNDDTYKTYKQKKNVLNHITLHIKQKNFYMHRRIDLKSRSKLLKGQREESMKI